MPTALVVDDEPDMRWLLAGVLQEQGFRVVTAGDGEAALEQIRREPPAVVLLDIRMPGVDGLQVLNEAKAVDPRLAVIMITAYGDVPSVVQAMKLGAADFLTKPFDNDEILVAVRRALERRELEAARLKAAKIATIQEVARAMSHEVRNPLTYIQGNAQILEMEFKDPTAAERLRVIVHGCGRIARVLGQLSSVVDPVIVSSPELGPMLDLGSSATARE